MLSHPRQPHDSEPAGRRQERAQRWSGLVSVHISEQTLRGRASVCPGGICLKTTGAAPAPSSRGDRGPIAGLSAAARSRLLLKLVRIPFSDVPAHALTLTWHNGFSPEPAKWHAQLHSWEVKLSRDWAAFGPSLVWMQEFQERGAPHFHVVVCWKREPVLAQLRRWVAASWNAIAEPGDEQHRRAGTRVDRIEARHSKGAKKLLVYLVKHAGKSKQKHRRDPGSGEDLPTGKMWDVFGELPQLVLADVDLAAGELVQLWRRLRRWGRASSFLSRMGKQFPGGVVIGAGPDLAQLLRGLAGVDPPRAPPLACAST